MGGPDPHRFSITGDIMDANQRSEVNNQTNNGANEKWTPGSEGNTAGKDQPLDHTYAHGAGGSQQRDIMGGGQPEPVVPGGSMETQINGGSGPVQGITDSHQRQVEEKSGAYGMLEQPVGHRQHDTGTNLNQQRDRAPPGGGMPGPGAHAGSAAGGREAQQGNMQQSVAGSRSMANQTGAGGVHESNDVAGGLPRSPGNGGADSTDRAGSQTGVDGAESGPDVHQSNDAAGGYPRSPGGANELAGDQNMDDDTGFKRKP
jgi:hypothetical protein